jgi:hypothetical protein
MKYNKGDIVLVKSVAGESIPAIHVKLTKRVIVRETKPKFNGRRWGMEWPGYSGWEAVAVYQKEIDMLRKEWSIPYKKPGEDVLFVYDEDIIHKKNKSKRNRRKRRLQNKDNN